ncbi:hypothetical protein BKA67DRAFT_584634 [Truncatella angustata]|uniref:Uncharacterized protein n=1 Tax=Truncatella angustata TaxID=152316 RepID=A0A9P8RFV5_9PEZI|nr:uncharacterized protein BKA67DRAFT_584634 [Truncatella angustata]KAH6645249.1 hypothetical protein BKA67DRAFT_584634 [Truncatella angustata]
MGYSILMHTLLRRDDSQQTGPSAAVWVPIVLVIVCLVAFSVWRCRQRDRKALRNEAQSGI